MLSTVAKMPWFQFNPLSLMNANKGVFGVNLGHMWGEIDRQRGWADQLLDLWAQGVIKPKIARSFSLHRSAASASFHPGSQAISAKSFWSRRLHCSDAAPPALKSKSAAEAALLVGKFATHGRLRSWLRHDADVGLRGLPALRVKLLRFFIGNRAGEDNVFALLPVRRRGYAVLGGELQRVDRPAAPRRNCGRWSSGRPEPV